MQSVVLGRDGGGGGWDGGSAQFRIGIERTDRQIQRETATQRDREKGGESKTFLRFALSFRWFLLTPTSGLRPVGYWTLCVVWVWVLVRK